MGHELCPIVAPLRFFLYPRREDKFPGGERQNALKGSLCPLFRCPEGKTSCGFRPMGFTPFGFAPKGQRTSCFALWATKGATIAHSCPIRGKAKATACLPFGATTFPSGERTEGGYVQGCPLGAC